MRPWQTLDRVATPAGELTLRQRGPRDFLLAIDGRVLMTSAAHRSEEALARGDLPAGRLRGCEFKVVRYQDRHC